MCGVMSEPNYLVSFPNWIEVNDWSHEQRLSYAKKLMATSSRDWAKYPHATPGTFDMESWILWCLICCDTKEEAEHAWISFADDHQIMAFILTPTPINP
jgi:hypothetical protein